MSHLNALSNFVDTMWGITTHETFYSFTSVALHDVDVLVCLFQYTLNWNLLLTEVRVLDDDEHFRFLFITFIYLTVAEKLHMISCFISYMNLCSWTAVLFWKRGFYFDSKPLAIHCWSVSLEMWCVIWKRKENIFCLCSSCTSAHTL